MVFNIKYRIRKVCSDKCVWNIGRLALFWLYNLYNLSLANSFGPLSTCILFRFALLALCQYNDKFSRYLITQNATKGEACAHFQGYTISVGNKAICQQREAVSLLVFNKCVSLNMVLVRYKSYTHGAHGESWNIHPHDSQEFNVAIHLRNTFLHDWSSCSNDSPPVRPSTTSKILNLIKRINLTYMCVSILMKIVISS